MKDNIKNIPITNSQRRKNKLGPLAVECQVSGRFLQFNKKSTYVGDDEFIIVDVFPMQIDDKIEPKKICELIITREDLLEALKLISPE
ncbi:hypothetical protein PE074_06400 [Wohlfahrtiimonas chitiniclastica]|uniref:hypothetical protein n=1 Tax=Wohlfahrtiimonas chitiniclastica TaxID=400946 RepID=UPI000AA56A9B|nr:hypothetical protein [Wohlfahrtiimonas chitiniclastica]MBS7814754.1 hypothetical protein [Wohlfahrtiimonas chitiniclastica]MBS7826476.1 hypothetical protein [Wohlfahrtiimonas chitiniclastica]WHR54727.1 hypothetical protein PE074_06400 [Wohlfahrtiimonas chitiniclastica]